MVVTFDLLRFPLHRALREAGRVVRHAPRAQASTCEPALVAALNLLPFPIGSPRELGLFCVWPDRRAADDFAERAPLARRWAERADEHLRLVLEPVSSHGTHFGEDPLPGLPHAVMPEGPVAIVTHGTAAGPREMRAFWRRMPETVAHLRTQPENRWSTGWAARPHHANTLSVWSSIGDVVEFAYRPGDHRPQVKRLREGKWASELWFARLRPLASSGSWHGQDPFAGLV